MAELPDISVSDPESLNPDPDLDLGLLLNPDLDPFPDFADPNPIRIRIYSRSEYGSGFADPIKSGSDTLDMSIT
jgi:hypothetical protein